MIEEHRMECPRLHDPEKPCECEQIMASKKNLRESIDFIVNMMNEGKADPKQVYPGGGRYHGD